MTLPRGYSAKVIDLEANSSAGESNKWIQNLPMLRVT
jgi:hypothetical protein